jgi:hypothetical protein
MASVAVIAHKAKTLIEINKVIKTLRIHNSFYFPDADRFIKALDIRSFDFLIIALHNLTLPAHDLYNMVTTPERFARDFDISSPKRQQNRQMNFIIIDDISKQKTSDTSSSLIPFHEKNCFSIKAPLTSVFLYDVLSECSGKNKGWFSPIHEHALMSAYYS